jgi:tight adherence protein C
MFWFQIIFPVGLTTIGILILFSNDLELKSQISRSYKLVKENAIKGASDRPDNSEIRDRLAEIGQRNSSAYGEFRYNQLLIAALAGLMPFFALLLMMINLVQAIGLSVFLGIGAYLMYDNHLSSLVKKRRESIESEFPAVLEMITLAIAAGETPVGAFARVVDRSDSLIASEFAKVVQQVRNGRPFHDALDDVSKALKSPAVRRFIDALVMALVRGAPIVEVLHRHVAEARINQRNLVMDKAGKAETTMMIPIVFLILPISVLFALWPSIHQLSFFAG